VVLVVLPLGVLVVVVPTILLDVVLVVTTVLEDVLVVPTSVVVVGGGPTGVEIAGQIAELSRRVLPKDFRNINPKTARVLLFDGGLQPLGVLPCPLAHVETVGFAADGATLFAAGGERGSNEDGTQSN